MASPKLLINRPITISFSTTIRGPYSILLQYALIDMEGNNGETDGFQLKVDGLCTKHFDTKLSESCCYAYERYFGVDRGLAPLQTIHPARLSLYPTAVTSSPSHALSGSLRDESQER